MMDYEIWLAPVAVFWFITLIAAVISRLEYDAKQDTRQKSLHVLAALLFGWLMIPALALSLIGALSFGLWVVARDVFGLSRDALADVRARRGRREVTQGQIAIAEEGQLSLKKDP